MRACPSAASSLLRPAADMARRTLRLADLDAHARLAESGFATRVLPSLRVDDDPALDHARLAERLASTPGGGMGMGTGMGMGMGMDAAAAAGNEVTALTFRVDLPRQPNAMPSPPTRLFPAPGVLVGAAAKVRTFSLDGGMMGTPFTINGRRFDVDRIDLAVPAGAVEIWRFVNGTGMAHPVHVHGVWMSLLSRDGGVPAPYEQGLRDTFVVDAMQTISVAVRTPLLASSVPLMFHCHILEHEDAGMMGQFVTT
mgnify:CR=1 FL=1